jgi:maleylpyruvate isomerase
MSRSFEAERGWVATGTDLCAQVIDGLDDAAISAPSALPGWSRAHVIAHLDGNARGLSNLATWARTGVETPMYASAEQRLVDIEAGAALPPAELRARFAESSAGLARQLDAMTTAEWSVEVRTVQGRTVPAREILWMRSREVMIHACDLLGPVSFDDLPDDFLVAVIDEIVQKRSATGDHPAITLSGAGRAWEITGAGTAAPVSGSLAQIGAYLTGRAPLGPALPAWL